MKIMIEQTSKIVDLIGEGGKLPARVWEGVTENGIPCILFVTRIAVEKVQDASRFEAELMEFRPPTPDTAALPPRMIL